MDAIDRKEFEDWLSSEYSNYGSKEFVDNLVYPWDESAQSYKASDINLAFKAWCQQVVTSPVKNINRLRKKLNKRDSRIAHLEKTISQLEHALATKELEFRELPRQITRAVQDALCNVRMIPVLGIGGSDKIVEVNSTDRKKS